MPGPESKHSIELGALPSKDTLKSPKNSKNSQNSVTLARSVDDNIRLSEAEARYS